MNDTILIILQLLLIGAALQDVAMLRISNLFPIALILLFGAWLYANGVPPSLWQNGVVFLIAAVAGIGLFAVRALGGGDVKLLAAIALWFSLQGGLYLLFYVTFCGGLLSLAFIFARRMVPVGARDRIKWPALKAKGPIPYGIAICGGALFALMLYGPNPNGRPKLPDLHISAFPDAAKAR